MNVIANRVRLGMVILAAVAVGFGLAHVIHRHEQAPPAGVSDAGNASASDDDHAEGDDPGDEAVVVLTARQIEASGISVVAVGRGGGNETRLTGRVEPTVNARAVVAATVSGRVERVVVAPGSRVRAGEALAMLTSGDAAALRASADAAAANADAARLAFQRDEALVARGVVARFLGSAPVRHALQ